MAAVNDTSIWLNQEVSVSKRTHTSVSKPAVQRHRLSARRRSASARSSDRTARLGAAFTGTTTGAPLAR
jgi:hypothetical protein